MEDDAPVAPRRQPLKRPPLLPVLLGIMIGGFLLLQFFVVTRLVAIRDCMEAQMAIRIAIIETIAADDGSARQAYADILRRAPVRTCP